MKVMLQAEAGECGLACLAMVSARLGRHLSLAELRQRFRVSVKGATLAQLARHAAELRLRARPVRLELEDLPDLALPAILHWDLNHFVVLHAVRRDWRGRVTLTVLDPALGQRRLSLEAASPHFTGIALELAAAADFEAGGHPPRRPGASSWDRRRSFAAPSSSSASWRSRWRSSRWWRRCSTNTSSTSCRTASIPAC
ncbi:Lactococcin-G-processing and transport ATP-binding protein LagD [Chromobacterium violaceum]|uniref:Lactococcin-G-processing and transport ATP-binding protein LagD n=1 Tax=Chromobacterium violaceum TaxID=536 RepID=A0A447TLP9_CHRVL|nr:Lactococcin-G-processing and transport ATP-binding protein LagD [Chromobacterium violaceum]